MFFAPTVPSSYYSTRPWRTVMESERVNCTCTGVLYLHSSTIHFHLYMRITHIQSCERTAHKPQDICI